MTSLSVGPAKLDHIDRRFSLELDMGLVEPSLVSFTCALAREGFIKVLK